MIISSFPGRCFTIPRIHTSSVYCRETVTNYRRVISFSPPTHFLIIFLHTLVAPSSPSSRENSEGISQIAPYTHGINSAIKVRISVDYFLRNSSFTLITRETGHLSKDWRDFIGLVSNFNQLLAKERLCHESKSRRQSWRTLHAI